MPQPPDAVYTPAVEIDDSRKWLLKLVKIDEVPSKYRDRRKDAMSLIHHWLVYDADTGIVVEDEATGQPFELWQWTSDATYDNAKSGKIAPAREVANALLGHRLDDDEIKAMLAGGWDKSLVGKVCIGDLEWFDTPEGYQRLRVLRLKPYRPRNTEPGPPEPPAPEPPGTPPSPPPAAPPDLRRIDLNAA